MYPHVFDKRFNTIRDKLNSHTMEDYNKILTSLTHIDYTHLGCHMKLST